MEAHDANTLQPAQHLFLDRPKRAFYLAGFWVLFTALLYLLNTTALSIRGIDVQYRKIAIFSSLWLLWAPLTFLAIWLARRFPITTVNTRKRIRLHILLSFLFALLHGLLFILVVNILADIIFPGAINKVYIYTTCIDNFVSQMIIYLLIVAIDQGSSYVIKFRDEAVANLTLKNQVSAAQNQLLKIQMQPHFLFNTHHSIISLMALNKTAEASEMLTKLSDLLRKTLDMPRKEFVTLKEETELVKLYLDIQAIRFGDRLSIQYNLPGETLDKPVPVFIIQPLVENAIRHGIEPVSYPATISISSFLKQQSLLIKIEDDGIGYNNLNTSTGIGISNIRERLKNHFNEKFSFHIGRKNPKGTIIEIEIPVT